MYLLETDRALILLDYGFFQGNWEEEKFNQALFPFDISKLDTVVLLRARIHHHLKHNPWWGNAHEVIVGYQSIGTPGRALIDGAKALQHHSLIPFSVIFQLDTIILIHILNH